MKNYFIDEVAVIINGNKTDVVTITGSGSYNTKMVENRALEIIKEAYPNAKLVAQIQNHKQVDLEEYERIIGSKPPWLIK